MDHPWTQNTESNPSKALRCVTTRQILRFTPGSRNLPFGMLMLVANVYRQSIDSQGCRWFGFDDGLGRIDGYKSQTERDSIFEPFAYARIIGESEHRRDRRLLKIFHIEPVYEAHEIFHHLLHTIIDTLSSERGSPRVDHHIPSSTSSIQINPQASQERMDYSIPVLHETDDSDSEDKLMPDARQIPSCFALSVLRADIIASISEFQVESGGDMRTGVHIISIVQEVQSRHPNVTVSEFFSATEQLLSECLIYTTIDDKHYACRSPRPRLSSDNLHMCSNYTQ